MFDLVSNYNNNKLEKAVAELNNIADSDPNFLSRLNKQLLSGGFAVLVDLGKVDSFYATLDYIQKNKIVEIIDYQGKLCEDYSYFDQFQKGEWNKKLESLWVEWKEGQDLINLCNGVWDEGEEFYDTKGNGVWDEGEEFYDTKGNGVWDKGETFIDALNDVWDEGEKFYDYGQDNCMDPWEDGDGGCLSQISKDYKKGDDPNQDNYTSSNPYGSQWSWNYNKEEYFIDELNSVYDIGEEFEDLPDGLYNEGESFKDLPDNAYNLGEKFLDLPCESLTPSCYMYDDDEIYEDTDFYTVFDGYEYHAPASPSKRSYYSFYYDKKPNLLTPNCVDYPISAKERGVSGKVVLMVDIDRNGKVSFSKYDIIEKTGTLLDQAAVDALIFSSWDPALKKIENIDKYRSQNIKNYKLEINFDLNSDCVRIEEFSK